MRKGDSRGFTLVELMVAVSGGLLLSIVVFMMARDGSRFYQSEARMANATMSALSGFQRLRVDIARAAYMSSPNINKDPFFCGVVNAGNGFTAATLALNQLAGVRIQQGILDDEPDVNQFRSDNGLSPDRLILAGAYNVPERFPVRHMGMLGSGASARFTITLENNVPPLARLGYIGADPTDQLAILQAIFTPDAASRALRITADTGAEFYGVIATVANELDGTQRFPVIELTPAITPQRKSSSNTCGYTGNGGNALVNVVNFIQYEVKSLRTNSDFNVVYENEVDASFDNTRTELVRSELDVAGAIIPGTEELVAEYAVDLKFSATAFIPGALPTLEAIGESDATDPEDRLLDFLGSAAVGGNASGVNEGPHLVRTLHARLAVRSRQGDREGDIDALAQGIPAGLYRVGLDGGGTPFARVRTLQADIALRNNERARWP